MHNQDHEIIEFVNTPYQQELYERMLHEAENNNFEQALIIRNILKNQLKQKSTKQFIKDWLVKLILCKIVGDHDWTSKGMQGLPMMEYEQGNYEEFMKSFKDHSKMYCSRCNKDSNLSKKFQLNIKLK